MAKDFDNKFDETKKHYREFLPNTSPDTWWELRRSAREKETIGATLFGTPTPLFGGKFRFIDRERFDAKRLEEKYDINETISNEVETKDVRNYTSESLIKIDEQGKIIIGADLEGTMIECFCSEEDEYSNWERYDAGTFLALGLSAGVNYVEVSSRDWMLTRYKRGITRFDDYLRIHGHNHGDRNRKTFGLKSIDFIKERELGDAFANYPGAYYNESNYYVLDVGHLQIKADRLLLDIDPSKIHWKQLPGIL